jgi:hypothetical protein
MKWILAALLVVGLVGVAAAQDWNSSPNNWSNSPSNWANSPNN